MRLIWLAGAFVLLVPGGFAAGCSVEQPPAPVAAPSQPSQDAIRVAQRASFWGLDPIWITASTDGALFRQVRDRAYGYCLRQGRIARRCADDQDEAVQAAVLTLMLVADQRQMPDRSLLDRKEREVAENPEIVEHVRSYCWALYNEHGGMDARLLSVCLTNLTSFTPLVPMPVVD